MRDVLTVFRRQANCASGVSPELRLRAIQSGSAEVLPLQPVKQGNGRTAPPVRARELRRKNHKIRQKQRHVRRF